MNISIKREMKYFTGAISRGFVDFEGRDGAGLVILFLKNKNKNKNMKNKKKKKMCKKINHYEFLNEKQ